jgi:phosphate transport system substrate-binding protein
LNQIDPSLPSTKLELFGPDTDSGTFDFFTDKINGEGAYRARTTSPRLTTT